MDSETLILCFVIAALVVNLLSITIDIVDGRQWQSIYLPFSSRTFKILRIGAVIIVIGFGLYEFIAKPNRSQIVLLLLFGFAILNGVSAIYRWRKPLPAKP